MHSEMINIAGKDRKKLKQLTFKEYFRKVVILGKYKYGAKFQTNKWSFGLTYLELSLYSSRSKFFGKD